MRKIVNLTVLFFLVVFPLMSQKAEPTDRYLLLATKQTSTMEKELDEAARQGFRILYGSPTSGTEMVLLLERVAKPPDTYQYRLLATNKTSTMEKEMAEAGGEGFRLMPNTAMAKKSAGLALTTEVVMIMERPPKAQQRYQYKLLATTKTSTMQKEIGEASAAGFVLIGLISRGEHMAVMEKTLP